MSRGGATNARALALASLLVLTSPACYDFHPTGPEDPAPLPLPATATVPIEYEQPAGCVSAFVNCQDLVVFLGSWMPPGGQIFLTPDPTRRYWTARVGSVPVNFPPNGKPYEVRIYDPHLQDDGRLRYTGRRLRLGGQALTQLQDMGRHEEAALVFVDANGLGHNPF